VDAFLNTVAEVITVQPPDDNDNGDQDGPAAAAPPMPEVVPPPPDAPPPTVSKGQTPDQVTAAFGQPLRIAKLGVKEIYYYKDFKVTFINRKVSNVE
jgi:hypothetical protein